MAPIRIFPTVGHGEQTRLIMLQLKVLICKCGTSVDGHAPRAVGVHKVTTLNHDMKSLSYFCLCLVVAFVLFLSLIYWCL